MMPPIVLTIGSGDMIIDEDEPVASEAEADGDDLIDVVNVNQIAGGLSANASHYNNRIGHNSPLAGKKYHCQRCLNHGLEIPRKGHKRECRFTDCQCDDCKLVEKRKILNREINSERERLNSNSPGPLSNTTNDKETNDLLNKVRNPRCARCRAHDPEQEPPPLKGHKKACRYKNCECKKCSLITCRRDVMAKQIRLRRKQKSKNGSTDGSSSSTNSDQQSPPTHQHSQNAKSNEFIRACMRANLQTAIKRPDPSKIFVNLVTPPINDKERTNHNSSNESNRTSSTTTTTNNNLDTVISVNIGSPTLRPQPTYPIQSLVQQQTSQQQQSLSDYCTTNANSPPQLFTTTTNPNLLNNSTNNNNGPLVHVLFNNNGIQPSGTYRDLASAATALCPQSLFASFLQYVQAMANVAAANAVANQNGPPAMGGVNVGAASVGGVGGGGLTLPTMPATMMLDQALATGLPVSFNPAHVAAALQQQQSAMRQQQRSQVLPPGAAEVCVIPCCLPTNGGSAANTNTGIPTFHPQQCFLGDQQRFAALTTAFAGHNQGQGPQALMAPHLFMLQ